MEYFKNPNLPDSLAKGVLADYRITNEAENELALMGIKVIKTQRIPYLYDAVCGHADMQIHHLGGRRFLSAPDTLDYYTHNLADADIIKGSCSLSAEYPKDIAYNAAVFGDFLICNKSYTAREILSEYNNKTVLNVRQGYAKCSVCIIGKNAIITSDKGIYNAAIKNRIDVLMIETGYIKLKNMSYGFIGGASGLIAPDILAVNGDIKTHKNCESIISFCKNYRVDILPLKSGEIEDIGSVLPIIKTII